MDISDEDIVCWIDNAADPALAARIKALDPRELQDRIDALSIDLGAIRAGFDLVSRVAPAAPVVATQPKVASRRTLWAGAALAACLAIGFVAGAQLSSSQDGHRVASWQEYAAAYHALYVAETLAQTNRPSEVKAAELTRVMTKIDADIGLADLVAEGLEFRRAQILGYQGKPLIQLAFVTEDGTPVALCILKDDTAGRQQLATRTIIDLPSAVWTKDGYDFLLVGHLSDQQIQSIAGRFAEVL